jgi:hypothetical protein
MISTGTAMHCNTKSRLKHRSDISDTIIRKYHITCDFYVTIFGEGSVFQSKKNYPQVIALHWESDKLVDVICDRGKLRFSSCFSTV